ncbi:MAG: oligosaccharide flippase family protein [Acidithiobacillus sp.]|nr:oligosaccharide flippase family protein [Acidithiobacillus sp.]
MNDSWPAWSPGSVVRKSLTGLALLTVKEILIGLVSVIGITLLARLLSPEDFGLYAILTFVSGLCGVFGNLGTGASLIASATPPSLREYRAVFTIEQMLGIGAMGIMWFLSPYIVAAYHLASRDVWMFRIASTLFWISSFRTVSFIKLEKDLRMASVAAIEIAGTFVYYGMAVMLAYRGFGVWSFLLAALSRAVISGVASLIVSPWKLAWGGIDTDFLRRHVRFGVLFQSSVIISFLKDSFTPIVVGLLIGDQAVGYLKWASTLAAYPLWVLGGLNRLYFPALSRLKVFPDSARAFLERVVWASNAAVAPVAVWLLVFINPIVRLIFGDKWISAIPLFHLFWFANLIVPTVAPLVSLFNAVGQPRRMLFFSAVWAVGEWAIGLPLTKAYGAIGVGIANFVVQFTNIALLNMADNMLHSRLWRRAWGSWTLASGMGISAAAIIGRQPIVSIGGLFIAGLVWMLGYGAMWYCLYKNELLKVLREYKNKRQPKQLQ